MPRGPLEVKVHVWEPRVLGISPRRRVSACGPRGVEFGRTSAIAGLLQEAKRLEFNSEAVAAAGFRVDTVAFERLEHTTRTKLSPILRRGKGGRRGGTFRSHCSLGGWCEADSVLF